MVSNNFEIKSISSWSILFCDARYYDPALGTFLSPDTLVPDAGKWGGLPHRPLASGEKVGC